MLPLSDIEIADPMAEDLAETAGVVTGFCRAIPLDLDKVLHSVRAPSPTTTAENEFDPAPAEDDDDEDAEG